MDAQTLTRTLSSLLLRQSYAGRRFDYFAEKANISLTVPSLPRQRREGDGGRELKAERRMEGVGRADRGREGKKE